jgi:Cu(I)/Ag(I) efflux system membrane fusion protein
MTSEVNSRPAFKRIVLGVTVLIALVIGFILGRRSGPGDGDVTAQHTGHGGVEKKAEVWTCAMHPQIKLPKLGQCPICGMDLIPLRTEAGDDSAGDMPNLRRLSMSAAAVGLAEIQTAQVRRMVVSKEIRMVGKVDYDETRVRTIAAWSPGRIDRMYVDYTGIDVKEGDHLVYIYSPELRTTQEELLQARKAVGALNKSRLSVLRESALATKQAAREKLRLLGLTPQQVREIEQRGTPTDHLTIYAPSGGTVVRKHAVEGMYVETGTPIYTIADLSRVWVRLDAYESDFSWIRYGQEVGFNAEAYPGETFRGRIAFIDPILNPKTRTAKVRVNMENPDGKLKPEMFVRAVVKAGVAAGGKVMDPSLSGKWISPMHPEVVRDEPGPCPVCGMPLVKAEDLGYVPASRDSTPLVVPASAPLVTGKRAVVYVKIPGQSKPTFEGREVVLGPRAGDHYVVKSGLSEGDEVVVKGNFKIDSALQILARPSMMSAEGGAGGGAHAHGGHDGGSEKPAEKTAAKKNVEVPASFREHLRPLYEAYAAIHEALGADDLGSALEAYGQFAGAVGGVDMTDLEGHPHMVWMDLSQRLSDSAVLGREADTLTKTREAFGSLSKEMIALASQFGPPPHQELAQIYCPMAFGGKGGAWLQTGENVRNPYFGSKMSSCGEIQKRFGAAHAEHVQ